MKKLLFLILISITLFSCKSESSSDKIDDIEQYKIDIKNCQNCTEEYIYIDSTNIAYYYQEGNYIYIRRGDKFYDNARITTNSSIIPIEFGFLIILIVIIFFIGLFIGLMSIN